MSASASLSFLDAIASISPISGPCGAASEPWMFDLLYLAAGLAFFAGSIGYALICDRL